MIGLSGFIWLDVALARLERLPNGWLMRLQADQTRVGLLLRQLMATYAIHVQKANLALSKYLNNTERYKTTIGQSAKSF